MITSLLEAYGFTEKNMDTTPAEAAQVIALLEAGHNQSEVARRLNLSRYSVRRVYQRFQETGGYIRRPGSGRRRTTSERDDRFLVTRSLRNRQLNAVQLGQQLREVRNVSISRWTVRRRLGEAGMTSHRPANGPKLTTAHRQARLQFAREHLNWTYDQWRAVMFSDECRMTLHGHDGRSRVYRRSSERFSQCCISERVAFGGGSCMFWGGIMLDTKTDIVFITTANTTPEIEKFDGCTIRRRSARRTCEAACVAYGRRFSLNARQRQTACR